MNWIFIDRETYQVKFGNRLASEGQLTGPWDCTRQDRRLVFSGWEGFCAVHEGGLWALYFDVDGDRLKGKLGVGDYVVIDIDLVRRELKTAKPQSPPTEEASPAAEVSKGDDQVAPSQPIEVVGKDTCQKPLTLVLTQEDDTISESGFSGVTFTSDEPGDTSSRRTEGGEADKCPSRGVDDATQSSAFQSEAGRDSARDWTSSVYSSDSYRCTLSDEEMDMLREDVD